MARVLMYALASSNDPDDVRCVVPWKVDQADIFFGPCKVRIREQFRRQYLKENCGHAEVTNGLYLVSVNGSNAKRVRKIVSAGKVAEVMTFAAADSRLEGERFQELREDKMSPLHVRPVIQAGELIGYKHVSCEHLQGGRWIDDLMSDRNKVLVQEREIYLQTGVTPWEAFDRDCCMLLTNLFFAQRRGIEFDKEAVEILKEAQIEKSGIDAYAIFGLTRDGQVNGLRGQYLDLKGDPGNRFVAWLSERTDEVLSDQRVPEVRKIKANCIKRMRCQPKRPIC